MVKGNPHPSQITRFKPLDEPSFSKTARGTTSSVLADEALAAIVKENSAYIHATVSETLQAHGIFPHAE